jgi:hypothetical protein
VSIHRSSTCRNRRGSAAGLGPLTLQVMRAFPTLFLAAVLAVACNGSAAQTPSAQTPGATAGTSTAPPSTGEVQSLPPVSDEPTNPPLESEPPIVNPSPPTSAAPGPAAACSGSDENRDFFRAAASVLRWTVYCAVLPSGWFVDSGQYRQASGGWVQIAYRGPAGARLELHEGAFCSAADGCVPSGTDAGDGQFGDKTGTAVALDDGGWAVVVDRAEQISWLAVGSGLDEAAFRKIAKALSPVGD